MHKLGFSPPPKLIKLCRILNNEVHAKVKIGEHLSSEFKGNKDFRQGYAVAPSLFTIVLETGITRVLVYGMNSCDFQCGLTAESFGHDVESLAPREDVQFLTN